MGVVAQNPPGESVPRSMVAACWQSSPWCLQHRHTSLRFFMPLLSLCLAHHEALSFWMQNLTDHIWLQSIFLLLWRSKGALFMCILVSRVFLVKDPLCDCCFMQQSPSLFICLYECLHSTLLLWVWIIGLHVFVQVSVKAYVKTGLDVFIHSNK